MSDDTGKWRKITEARQDAADRDIAALKLQAQSQREAIREIQSTNKQQNQAIADLSAHVAESNKLIRELLVRLPAVLEPPVVVPP